MAPPNPCSPRRAWKRFTVARYHSTGRRNGGLREATLPGLISEKLLDGSMNPAVPAIPSERTNCRRDSICSASGTGKSVLGHDVFYSDSINRQSVAASVLLHRSTAQQQVAQNGHSAGKDSADGVVPSGRRQISIQRHLVACQVISGRVHPTCDLANQMLCRM